MGKTQVEKPFWYAIAAAVLYSIHQVFTTLASAHTGDGLSGFIVEISAALIIAFLSGLPEVLQRMETTSHDTRRGLLCAHWSMCVGAGTWHSFCFVQKGGPLSAVPMVLAEGAALMAIGIVFFKEPVTLMRLSGVALSLIGLFLLRYTPTR